MNTADLDKKAIRRMSLNKFVDAHCRDMDHDQLREAIAVWFMVHTTMARR